MQIDARPSSAMGREGCVRCVGVVTPACSQPAAAIVHLLTENFLFFFCLALVLAVDTTRVEILEADPEVAGSDYINANYIRVSPESLFAQ